MGDDMNSDQFLAGQRACIAGDECPKDATVDFKRGYGAQYAAEQSATWFSDRGISRGCK